MAPVPTCSRLLVRAITAQLQPAASSAGAIASKAVASAHTSTASDQAANVKVGASSPAAVGPPAGPGPGSLTPGAAPPPALPGHDSPASAGAGSAGAGVLAHAASAVPLAKPVLLATPASVLVKELPAPDQPVHAAILKAASASSPPPPGQPAPATGPAAPPAVPPPPSLPPQLPPQQPPPPAALPTPAGRTQFGWLGWLIPAVGVPLAGWTLWHQYQLNSAQNAEFEEARKAVVAGRSEGTRTKPQDPPGGRPAAASTPASAPSPSPRPYQLPAAGNVALSSDAAAGVSDEEASSVAQLFTGVAPPGGVAPRAKDEVAATAEQGGGSAPLVAADTPGAPPSPALSPFPPLVGAEPDRAAADAILAANQVLKSDVPDVVKGDDSKQQQHPLQHQQQQQDSQPVPASAGAGELGGKASHTGPLPAGAAVDLTPEGLLRYGALVAAVDDTPEAAVRRRQATADAQAFQQVMAQKEAQQQRQLEQVRQEMAQSAHRAESAERAKAAATAEFQALLQLHEAAAAELREREVMQAERRMAKRASEALQRERVERVKQLDEVRSKVGALSKAFDATSAALSSSALSHRVTLGILSLQGALASGAPFSGDLALLAHACGGDPVVVTALASLPAEQAAAGIPTRSQLEAQFRSMRPTLGELHYFPKGRGGMLAHLVAKAANLLKVDEGRVVKTLGQEASASIDAALARTEQLLVDGQLPQAADVLGAAVQGSTASHAAEQWLAAVHARALADQAIALLQAHATSLAAVIE